MCSWFTVATLVSTDSAVNQGWCTPFGCVSEAVIAQGFLLFGLAALICFALAVLSFVPEARSVVREERSRAAAERDAFGRFRKRVASLDPTRTRMSDGGRTLEAGTLRVPPDRDDRLDRVRTAYRETVMGVDHYVDEYDEPLGTNLGAEFSDGVADMVVGGGTFTPALRQTLLEGAGDARERRARLCRALDTEADTLQSAAGTLRDVESLVEETEGSTLGESYETLVGRWGRLSSTECTVKELLSDQQSSLQAGYGVAPRLGGPVSLHEYLYAAEPYTHPVLAEATDLLGAVNDAQDRTAVAISRRV